MPSLIWEKLRQRSERPLFLGGTNPCITVDESGQRGESPLLCADNSPSILENEWKKWEMMERYI